MLLKNNFIYCWRKKQARFSQRFKIPKLFSVPMGPKLWGIRIWILITACLLRAHTSIKNYSIVDSSNPSLILWLSKLGVDTSIGWASHCSNFSRYQWIYCPAIFPPDLGLILLEYTYTVLHIFRQVLFCAGNQGNHQNFEKSFKISYKCYKFSLG